MMTIRSLGCAVGLSVVLTGTALAAEATSFRYLAEIVTEDENIYAEYEVNCSGIYKNEMRAWDNEQRWCVGSGTENTCFSSSVEAARQACDILASK